MSVKISEQWLTRAHSYRSETETEESEAEVARTIKYVSDVIEISSDEEEEEPRCVCVIERSDRRVDIP